jgi:mevalonate kinase
MSLPAAAPIAVSAPGKLILMGEHAVVYGRPAIAAALDLRLTVHLTPLPAADADAIQLDLPGLAHAEETTWDEVRAYARAAQERWGAYAANPAAESFATVRGDDPAHLVKVALGEAAQELESLPLPFSSPFPGSGGGLRLQVLSQLPVGSGFGSSAATATAVVAALVVRHGGSLENAADRAAIERIAFAAERRQHGLPSGIDGATVLYGGLLWARKLAGGLETAPIALRSPILDQIRVYDTGMPAEPTGAVVAAVRARRERDPPAHERTLDRIAAATAAFRAELEAASAEPARIVHLFREAEECLEELGVVPAGVRSLVRRIEAEGGAAKISGAGSLTGPGAGSLLVYHPDVASFSAWSFLQNLPFHPVRLGAPGLRGETDA